MKTLLRTLLTVCVVSLAACQTSANMEMQMNEPLAEGTNREFSHEVKTDASPEAIWTLWTDVTSWKEWDQGLEDAEMRALHALAEGLRGGA